MAIIIQVREYGTDKTMPPRGTYQCPGNVTYDPSLPGRFGHEITNGVLFASTNDHDGIHKLVGMIDCKENWSIRGNVFSSNDFNFAKKDTQNTVKENLDSKIDQCFDVGNEDVRHANDANDGDMPVVDSRKYM